MKDGIFSSKNLCGKGYIEMSGIDPETSMYIADKFSTKSKSIALVARYLSGFVLFADGSKREAQHIRLS